MARSNRKKFVEAFIVLAGFASFSASAALIHDYELNGTLIDSLGGPSLAQLNRNSTNTNGTIGPTGYTFPYNAGLQLSNGLPNSANYSIEMRFSLDSITATGSPRGSTWSWVRILDFKNGSTDMGLYDYSGALQFYPYQMANGFFTAGAMADIIITRNSSTNMFDIYAGGMNVYSLPDLSGDAIFSAANNVMNFFVDDIAFPDEATSGFVDFIRIFDAPMTSTEAACLQTGSPVACGIPTGGPTIPEPGTVALLGLGLAGLAVSRRRKP